MQWVGSPRAGGDRGTGSLVTVLEQGHQPRRTKPRARLSRECARRQLPDHQEQYVTSPTTMHHPQVLIS